LTIILDHFDNYGLITQKLADYLLFKMGFEIFKQKAHLTGEGLQSIVAIKASLNLGISDDLKAAFPDINPVPRPLVENLKVPHPEWMAGFASGDGSFSVGISPSPDTKVKFSVGPEFKLTQHNRDKALLESFIAYFGCGSIHVRSQENTVDYRCRSFADINQKIIPFFQKHNILGVKAEDFLDLCKVIDIMEKKGHLTSEGLNQIREIKSGMNKERLVNMLPSKDSVVLNSSFGFPGFKKLKIGLVKLSKDISSLSTGVVTSYALYILIGFIGYLSVAYLGLLDFNMVLLFILATFSLSTFNYNYGYNKNKILQSNFFKSFLCWFYKIKDIIYSNLYLILILYFTVNLFYTIYNLVYPEFPIMYVSEPNKENSIGGDESQYVYKSPADKIHEEIKRIDQEIQKLDPNSKDYLKEKEDLELVRSEFENQMSLISQFKSTRAKYIPDTSDYKRVGDNNIASASKRTRD
jgi:hypothetical protein